MIINVEIMKKINSTIDSGDFMPISQLEQECALDANVLKIVTEDLDKPLTSMNFFFKILLAYIGEMEKRVKMMDECYAVIQKLQIENKIIDATPDNQEPAIIWMDHQEQDA